MLSLRDILERKTWTEYDKDNIYFMIFEDEDLEEAIEMREDEKLSVDKIDKYETYRIMEDNLLRHFTEEIGIGLRGFIADSLVLKDE